MSLQDEIKISELYTHAGADYQACLNALGVQKAPFLHTVLGSGYAQALSKIHQTHPHMKHRGSFSFEKIRGLTAATVPGHPGAFQVYEDTSHSEFFVFQQGRLHGYEGHAPQVAVLPVMAARFAGVTQFLLTNASGGLDVAHRPGDVMLIRDQVNMTGLNPLVGPNVVKADGTPLGPRFPDMSQVYEIQWREELRMHLMKSGLKVHEGNYMGLLGPSFETPAEVQLFASWGMHAVGMSTVWEGIALKHSGAKVGGLALISNAACGMGDGKPLDHELILETCAHSAEKIMDGIFNWIGKLKA